ncbi:NAD-dependent epimerase/dehydratase family protein [Streptomyces sp. SudanB182_2057]|uniref:NAD-dependent epimerase/dehydratase family protein n=1 Tax=Streptomyces sp. SudanB182_2057 TaxID=3035281 RepID=UPI003F54DDE8
MVFEEQPVRRVLITGAAGFIGRHVVQEAARRDVRLRLMAHSRRVPDTVAHRQVVPADLTDPSALRGVCDGVDVLLHCASHIGGTLEANEAVNTQGTRNLLDEARRAGVRRIVYVSTAAVYGRGAFRNATPTRLTRNPGSPTSVTRAKAEDMVLDAGGTVLRPHLVHGAGDNWLLPGLVRLLRTLPATVEGWTARLSVIAASDLARLTVSAGLASSADLTAPVYHATHPDTVTADTLLRAVAAHSAIPWPHRDLSVAEARSLLADDSHSAHGLEMLTSDHWFDGTPLWRDLGLVPGPAFDGSFTGQRDDSHRR